jgi:hypothetical protein
MKRFIPLLVLAALLLIPMLAQAQRPITLEPTKYGVTINASGEALREILPVGEKEIQVFTLAVHADVANREALSISIETKRGVFELGDLRMLLSMGAMEKWDTIEPSPVFPVDQLITITVRYGKTDILYGYF